jgi:N-acetylmuramoyl-L-alanine amidase
MKIGLAVGHSRLGDQGAYSHGEYILSEWDFNRDMVRRIAHVLSNTHGWATGDNYVVYDHYPARSYSGAINYLARKLKEDEIDAVIELHFNSARPSVSGHEWLYWHSSSGGKRLATALRDEMEEAFPDMKSRGIKPRQRKQRGSYLLRVVPPYAVIAEPFFGSHIDSWREINNNRGKLAGVYARAVVKFVDE